jgi:hypothetical protein
MCHLIRIIRGNRTATNSQARVVFRRTRNLTSKLLKRLALRLRNEEGSEDPQKHEKGENLHDVIEPRIRVVLSGTLDLERADQALGDDRTNFSGSG